MRIIIQLIGCAVIGWVLGTSGLPFIVGVTLCIPACVLWQVICIAVGIKIMGEKINNDK